MRLGSRGATLFVFALMAAFGVGASGIQIVQSSDLKKEKKERHDGQEIFRRVRNRQLGSEAARKLVRELDLFEARLAV